MLMDTSRILLVKLSHTMCGEFGQQYYLFVRMQFRRMNTYQTHQAFI